MTTQDDVLIKEVRDNVAILKDGSMVVILETSAVNFDLLSENEQLAIIATFAAMLNSLSFAIQIVIRSIRLDISNYLNHLVEAEQKQGNPLLKQMINRYRLFVETIIRENEVLDKQFFIVLSISALEIGLERDVEQRFKKAMTMLLPRVDHIERQISRIGLKATRLTDDRLMTLFYDLYNQSSPLTKGEDVRVSQPAVQRQQPPILSRQVPQPQIQQQIEPKMPVDKPAPGRDNEPIGSQYQNSSRGSSSPFVVEELPDEYGTA